jgi:4-hydroxybenzoate polyprenyltransferase
VTALLGAVVLAAGVAYDIALKPTPFASIPYAVAFTILPLYAWYGAAGGPPPQPELLLPVAALAGPTLQLANGLVDLEADQAAGLRGPAVILGRVRATVMLILLQAVIHGSAWLSVAGQGPSVPAVVALAAGTTCAGVGVRLTAGGERGRERGWQLQAAGIVCLAFGWLLGVAGP